MMQTFLPKYAACAAPFSPAGPAPITTRSKCSIGEKGEERRELIPFDGEEGVFCVGQPAALVFDTQFHFGAERYRQVRILVSGRKVHQHRHIQVLDEVE